MFFATFQIDFAILHQAVQRWEVLSTIYRTKNWKLRNHN